MKNKFKIKLLIVLVVVMFVTVITSGVFAASASISASSTSVTVGTKVTITAKVTAAAWNLNVSGSGVTGSIVGFNSNAENQTTTKTYTLNTSKTGTYKVSLTGDMTDASAENASMVSKSVTVTVKAKPATTTTTKTPTTTTTSKSSNANLSKLILNVEGLSFSKSQTTYSIKVGETVNNISVSATPENSKATYTISGNKNLKAGSNVIKIVVVAEDGTTKTYKINVEKAGNIEETSSLLANLIIEDMTFTEPFSKNITEYTGSKMKYTKSLNILPYVEAEQATYEIIGNSNFKEGENTVIVKVTSKDKSSVTEYKITFEMLSSEETDALVTVSPYVEVENTASNFNWKNNLLQVVKENSTILLLYALALVEFIQVVYLYVQLKNIDPNVATSKRRNKDVTQTKTEETEKEDVKDNN